MAKKIPNDLILQENVYSFSGVAETPEPSLLVLEMARSWQNGGVSEDVLRDHGLPYGNDQCHVDDVRDLFRDVHECVCWLAASGAFKNSPQIEAIGFPIPEYTLPFHDPKRELAAKLNKLTCLMGNVMLTLSIKSDSFVYEPFPKATITGWAYTGIAQLAVENGEKNYAICAWERCSNFFRNATGRGMYCSSSHRVRAAQTRERN